MPNIEPFQISVPDSALADLKARLKNTRFPDEVPDTGWEYGTNLAYLKELVEYWRDQYDWRAHERQINRLAHFKANVDGNGIHFIHEKGKGPSPKPILLIHGWPGSILEFEKLIGPLTHPKDQNSPAFDVIIPSLPGFGYSGPTTTRGWGPLLMARALVSCSDGSFGLFQVRHPGW